MEPSELRARERQEDKGVSIPIHSYDSPQQQTRQRSDEVPVASMEKLSLHDQPRQDETQQRNLNVPLPSHEQIAREKLARQQDNLAPSQESRLSGPGGFFSDEERARLCPVKQSVEPSKERELDKDRDLKERDLKERELREREKQPASTERAAPQQHVPMAGYQIQAGAQEEGGIMGEGKHRSTYETPSDLAYIRPSDLEAGSGAGLRQDEGLSSQLRNVSGQPQPTTLEPGKTREKHLVDQIDRSVCCFPYFPLCFYFYFILSIRIHYGLSFILFVFVCRFFAFFSQS
jgi:hypothetical protein